MLEKFYWLTGLLITAAVAVGVIRDRWRWRHSSYRKWEKMLLWLSYGLFALAAMVLVGEWAAGVEDSFWPFSLACGGAAFQVLAGLVVRFKGAHPGRRYRNERTA